MARPAGFHVFDRCLGIGTDRINEHGHTAQPFRSQLSRQKIDTREVAARPGEARNKTNPNWVFSNDEGNGDRGGCRLGRGRSSNSAGRDDHGGPSVNQIGCQRRQPIKLIVSPAIIDRHVLALDKASILQALAERAQKVRELLRKPTTGIAACCARAASGHVAAAPPSKVMNSRRLMRVPHLWKGIVSIQIGILEVLNDVRFGS